MNINLTNKEVETILGTLSRLIRSEQMLEPRTIEPTYDEVMALITLYLEINKHFKKTI